MLKRASQIRAGSFFVPDNLRPLIITFLLQSALIACSATVFIFALFFLMHERQRMTIQPWVFVGPLFAVWYDFGWPFFLALSETSAFPWYYFIQYSFLYAMVWVAWGAIFLKLQSFSNISSKITQALWVVILPAIWEPIGVGWNNVGVMFMGGMFAPIYIKLGTLGIVFVFFLALVDQRFTIALVFIFSNLNMPQASSLKEPLWLKELTINPEGVEKIGKIGSGIFNAHIEDQQDTFNASVGWGDVEGTSLKRHLVPVVESGFTPGSYSRLMTYKGHTFLVLICNDALFSDIYDEVKQAEVIIIVNNLFKLESTPMPRYFFNRAQYLQSKYNVPVKLVGYSD